jgi:hypothetical protein
MIQDTHAFFSTLEDAREKTVRERLPQGVYAKEKHQLIHKWLRKQDAERISTAAKRAEVAAARTEEIASSEREFSRATISRQLRLTRRANIAAYTAAAAVIVSIKEIIEWLFKS